MPWSTKLLYALVCKVTPIVTLCPGLQSYSMPWSAKLPHSYSMPWSTKLPQVLAMSNQVPHNQMLQSQNHSNLTKKETTVVFDTLNLH